MEKEPEVFKSIIGFEGLYEISSWGRVVSLAKDWVSGKGIFKSKGDTLMSVGVSKGYAHVNLSSNKKRKTRRIHRLVAMHFCENKYNVVNHLDGNKVNNYYKNLEWTTSSGNTIHSLETGLKIPLKGKDHPGSKLTEDDVRAVRKLYSEGVFQSEIGRRFNINQQQVSKIVLNKRWSHI